MITKLFLVLRVASINSQTFANGYYYEYSLENDEDGAYRVMRRMRNRYAFSDDEPAIAVETDEQLQECRQALMYNFPHAFNIDGSVAIERPTVQHPVAPDQSEPASQTL